MAVLLHINIAICQINIIQKPLNFGHTKVDTLRTIDVVVLHSSYCPTLADSFNLACILDLYKKYDVSAHYIISRDGQVWELVLEQHIAHHAGKCQLPDGDHRGNTRSIGIEIINTKATTPTELQYQSLAALVKNICNRHTIKYILGHHHIAPARKTDPWNFDWEKFYASVYE